MVFKLTEQNEEVQFKIWGCWKLQNKPGWAAQEIKYSPISLNVAHIFLNNIMLLTFYT